MKLPCSSYEHSQIALVKIYLDQCIRHTESNCVWQETKKTLAELRNCYCHEAQIQFMVYQHKIDNFDNLHNCVIAHMYTQTYLIVKVVYNISLTHRFQCNEKIDVLVFILVETYSGPLTSNIITRINEHIVCKSLLQVMNCLQCSRIHTGDAY